MMAIELRGRTIAVKIRLEMVMKMIRTVVEFLSIQVVSILLSHLHLWALWWLRPSQFLIRAKNEDGEDIEGWSNTCDHRRGDAPEELVSRGDHWDWSQFSSMNFSNRKDAEKSGANKSHNSVLEVRVFRPNGVKDNDDSFQQECCYLQRLQVLARGRLQRAHMEDRADHNVRQLWL